MSPRLAGLRSALAIVDYKAVVRRHQHVGQRLRHPVEAGTQSAGRLYVRIEHTGQNPAGRGLTPRV